MADGDGSLLARVEALERELAELKQRLESGWAVARDAAGRERARLESAPNDTALRLLNEAGEVALSIGVDGTGCGYLGICNASGKIVVKLDVERYGARLELLDSHFGSESAVVIHGNDCDDAGGWIKLLPPRGDGETLLTAPEVED